MKHRSKAKKGQFSIIAALLTVTIMVSAVIMMYATIRNLPFNEPPKILSSLEELNLSLKQLLEFSIGYYGSVMQVTGNVSYAKGLTLNYLQSGLVHIAHSHPEWNPSFEIKPNSLDFSTRWYEIMSYSIGNLSITYSMPSLGMSKITYNTSATLNVGILDTVNGKSKVLVTREGNKPDLSLGKGNFFFYKYSDSTWNLINPSTEPTVFSNGTYMLQIPSGVDQSSYLIKVSDSKGIMAIAFFSTSRQPRYTCTLTWNSTLYSSLTTDTIVVEALQNGTLRWLGQNLQFSTSAKPIIPIPVRILHVNQSISGISREVPFQVEDWGSNYRVPLGLTSNASLFGDRQMIVFLVNHNVQKVTLWWDGRDSAKQTSFAWTNRYFKDKPASRLLTNGILNLTIDWVTPVTVYDKCGETNPDIASRAIDDDIGTFWQHSSSDNHWIILDMGKEMRISKIRIFQSSTSSQRWGQSNGVEVYVSNNPGSWGSAVWTGTLDASGWQESGSFSATGRYVRLRSRSTSSSQRLYEVDVESHFTITSRVGTSTSIAQFLRINDLKPTYGADPAYVIYNGSVRDIVQQEAEWSGGVMKSSGASEDCPNVYSQIYLTLPANATYYTYATRLIFINSSQSRTVTDLSAIQLTSGWISGLRSLTENGTSNGLPIIGETFAAQNKLFYNFTSPTTGWAHHWSEYTSGSTGAGMIVTDSSNRKLYTFDNISPANKKGALSVTVAQRTTWTTPTAVYGKCGEDGSYPASRAIDGSSSTYWQHSSSSCNHWIILDMGKTMDITKIRINQHNSTSSYRWGYPNGIAVYVSNDTSTWRWVGNWTLNSGGWQESGSFSAQGRYVKLYSRSTSSSHRLYEVQVQTQERQVTIEFNPVERYSASFTYPLDVTWHGAIVTFNNEPIYPTSGNKGLWIIAEYPPKVAID